MRHFSFLLTGRHRQDDVDDPTMHTERPVLVSERTVLQLTRRFEWGEMAVKVASLNAGRAALDPDHGVTRKGEPVKMDRRGSHLSKQGGRGSKSSARFLAG